jgi:phosphofructokinase-like protein
MSSTRRIGILTGGGDAPGLNAVIRAVVKAAVGGRGWDVVGVQDCFNGLLSTPRRLQVLTPPSCRGLLPRGGTMLGTTNHDDPFQFGPDRRDVSAALAAAAADERLDGLIVIGGDGTMRITDRLRRETGLRAVGVPKTIDNDLSATDVTFGFQSAVDCASDALDRLHTTAESHQRVMILEVMGRDAGHIALHSGISGGADVVLIPEIPYDPARVVAKIRARADLGRSFTIVVVAEGALPVDAGAADRAARKERLKRGGGAAAVLIAQLEGTVDAELRATVLGHLQRGGSPVAADRLLATRFGVGAVELVAADRWGEMVALRNGAIVGVPLADAMQTRFVAADSDLLRVARSVGIELGAGA